MSVSEVVEDLNTLRRLAGEEVDEARRRALETMRRRLADRGRGAKISEAADVLGVSPPTVRAWVKAAILEEATGGGSPQRVDVLRLADVKRIVDMLRAEGQNRDLLAEVYRRLRDSDLLSSPGLEEGVIAELCQRFHVRRLSIFGSAVTSAFDPETSDVDFLVEFDDGATDLFGAYFDLKEALETLLGRPVDLVTPKSLENPYFAESVERTRRDLYAA